jgi:hypothetical protein
MPFDSTTGANIGRKGGLNRWKGKDPATKRTELFSFKLSPCEMEMLNEKATIVGVSRGELIIRAIKAYNEGMDI